LSEDAQINILLYLYDYSPYPFWDVKPWLSCKPASSHDLGFPIWNSRGDQAEAKSSQALATLLISNNSYLTYQIWNWISTLGHN
jgi:hypothetical protein